MSEEPIVVGPEREQVNLDDSPIFWEDVPQDADSNPVFQAINEMVYSKTPEEQAKNFKEHGDETYKEGPKMYKHAIQYYTQALDAKSSDQEMNFALYNNRAQVHLKSKNFGHCIEDCQSALSLFPTKSIKPFYRAMQANIALAKWEEAIKWGKNGLKVEPDNKTIKNDVKKVEALFRKEKNQVKKKERLLHQEVEEQKNMEKLFRERNYCLGQNEFNFRQQYGDVKATFKEGALFFPVLFLYPDVEQSDFVREMHEDTVLGDQLAEMFPSANNPDVLVPWDENKAYTVETIEAFYNANLDPLPRFADMRKGTQERQFKKIDLRSTLREILSKNDSIIPGIPIIYVVLKGEKSKLR
eukprot:GCRY01005039.1.p1 GENE.GCRY01005039.1~~GCRY01005039.1.p1  ORF type:complete len:355 (-),score=50.64 GCRY01005039.1:49-1113(-)